MSEQLRKIDSLEAFKSYLDTDHGYDMEEVRDGWWVLPSWLPNVTDNVYIKYLLGGDMTVNGYALPEGVEPSDEATADNFWIMREAVRFEFGVYKKRMPAHFERLRGLRRDLWWHFLHVSVEDPSMVAYTPSHEYGKRDRQVRVKIGKYLTQFYSEHLSPEEIRAVVNMCKPHEVKFAVTREQIAYVYIHGPHSCMSGREWGHLHPAMVYEGEFRLAYLESGEQIVARGFVHDPSKTFVRVYGDEGQTLADSLEAMGFTRAGAWPDGAKLKRIEDGRGRVFMPYIDGGIQSVIDCGSHFEINYDGDYSASNTSGFLDERRDECENCGEYYDSEEDGAYSEHHGMNICQCCADNEFVFAFTSRRNRDYVRNDEAIEVGGEYYVNDDCVLSDHDIHQCTHTGDHYHIDDLVVTASGDFVCSEYAVPVGESEDEPKFECIDGIDLDFTVHFDPSNNAVRALVHPDCSVDNKTRDMFPDTWQTMTLKELLVTYGTAGIVWEVVPRACRSSMVYRTEHLLYLVKQQAEQQVAA